MNNPEYLGWLVMGLLTLGQLYLLVKRASGQPENRAIQPQPLRVAMDHEPVDQAHCEATHSKLSDALLAMDARHTTRTENLRSELITHMDKLSTLQTAQFGELRSDIGGVHRRVDVLLEKEKKARG